MARLADQHEAGRKTDLLLVGPAGAGKTALLRALRALAGERGFIPVAFSFRTDPPASLLHRRFAAVLLSAAGETLGWPIEPAVPPEAGLETLLARAGDALPATRECWNALERAPAGRPGVLGLLGGIHRDLGRPVVALLDDVGRLVTPGEDFWHELATAATDQPGVWYVVAVRPESRAHAPEALAPVAVGPLDREAAAQVLRAHPGVAARIPAELAGAVAELLDDLSGPLVVLARRLALLAAAQPALTGVDLVTRALADELLIPGGALGAGIREAIEGAIDRRGLGTYLAILSGLARGERSVSRLARALGVEMPALPYYLGRLTSAGLIVHEGRAYRVASRLAELWLRQVYTRQEESYPAEPEELAAVFRAELAGWLPSVEPIPPPIEGPPTPRLPDVAPLESPASEAFARSGQFREVRAGDLGGQTFDLVAWTPEGGLWLGTIAFGRLDAADLAHFAEKVERVTTDQKVERKLIFALAGFDTGVARLALQSGVQIWDLPRLNALRLRHGLPPV